MEEKRSKICSYWGYKTKKKWWTCIDQKLEDSVELWRKKIIDMDDTIKEYWDGKDQMTKQLDRKANALKSQIEDFSRGLYELQIKLDNLELSKEDREELYQLLKFYEKEIVSSDSFIEYWKISQLIRMFGEIPTTFTLYKVDIYLDKNNF